MESERRIVIKSVVMKCALSSQHYGVRGLFPFSQTVFEFGGYGGKLSLRWERKRSGASWSRKCFVQAGKRSHDGKKRRKKAPGTTQGSPVSPSTNGDKGEPSEKPAVNPPPRITQHINIPVRQQIRIHRQLKSAEKSNMNRAKVVPQRFVKKTQTTEEFRKERARVEAEQAELSKQESKNFALRQLYGTNGASGKSQGGKFVARLRAAPPPPVLLVDGYNVLFKWKAELSTNQGFVEESTDSGPVSLQEARDSLIDNLGEYSQIRGIRVVIAFDALSSSSSGFREETLGNGVTVAWCTDREADSYIESQVKVWLERKHPMVVVATSDVLQRTVVDANAIKSIEESCGKQVCYVIPSSGLIKDMEASLAEAHAKIEEYNALQGPGTGLLGSAVKAKDDKTFKALQSLRLSGGN